eukprot:14472899-Ditylum_brightwellii.AAC.1
MPIQSTDTTIKAGLADLCNMIAKLNPQANHMQQPPTYHQPFQARPQAQPPTHAQQPSYVWNGWKWIMVPPMPFQNLTNIPDFQPQQNQKKRAQKAYCWTHCWCRHPGNKCKTKAPGH